MTISETALPPLSHRHQNSARQPLLANAEWVLLGLVAAISLAGFVSARLSQLAVDWMSFFPAFGASLALMAIGVFIRARRNMPRMALGAIGFGVFMLVYFYFVFFVYNGANI